MTKNAPQTHETTVACRQAPSALSLSYRIMACALACVLALFGIAPIALEPTTAHAETTDTDATPDAFQLEIEQSAAAYNEATERIAELEQQIADNELKVTELESDLPEQQERGAQALRTLYKLQQEGHGLLELILDAENLNDFLKSIEYLDRVQQRNVAELDRLQALQDDLSSTKTSLTEAKDAAYDEQQHAEEALAAAQAAREEAQRKAQEEARAQAEAAAREAEQAAAEQEKAAQKEAEAAKESESTPDAPKQDAPAEGITEPVQPPTNDNADWSSDKDTFVAAWSGRIDAYLAGSPLSGQGATFAAAAWDYGVDPRWSPAISNTESTKGAHCFKPYNAWGWGNVSWGSWEEAINAHVRGLANGYGYTLTVEAAKKYNPSSWQHWYDVTLAQMNMI